MDLGFSKEFVVPSRGKKRKTEPIPDKEEFRSSLMSGKVYEEPEGNSVYKPYLKQTKKHLEDLRAENDPSNTSQIQQLERLYEKLLAKHRKVIRGDEFAPMVRKSMKKIFIGEETTDPSKIWERSKHVYDASKKAPYDIQQDMKSIRSAGKSKGVMATATNIGGAIKKAFDHDEKEQGQRS